MRHLETKLTQKSRNDVKNFITKHRGIEKIFTCCPEHVGWLSERDFDSLLLLRASHGSCQTTYVEAQKRSLRHETTVGSLGQIMQAQRRQVQSFNERNKTWAEVKS